MTGMFTWYEYITLHYQTLHMTKKPRNRKNWKHAPQYFISKNYLLMCKWRDKFTWILIEIVQNSRLAKLSLNYFIRNWVVDSSLNYKFPFQVETSVGVRQTVQLFVLFIEKSAAASEIWIPCIQCKILILNLQLWSKWQRGVLCNTVTSWWSCAK